MPSREAAESPRSAPRRQAAAPKDSADLLSPRFRSAAALAGWDEESILLAALVVEDTPVRESRRKRRLSSSASGSAGSNTRKRRSRRQSPGGIPPEVLELDDDEKEDNAADGKKEVKEKHEEKVVVVGENEAPGSGENAAAPTAKLPCMDRLQEELSCAICLEICFEPSTTPCGHSFCMKCLKHAAAKCGKRCPKCRQLISSSRSVTINTVLWNTIQLLFPGEVEARRPSMASSSSCNDDVNRSSPRSTSFSQGGMRTRSNSGNFIAEGRTRSSHRSFVTPGSHSHRSFVTPASTTSSNTSGSFISAHGGQNFISTTRVTNRRTGFVPASRLVTARRSSVRSDQSEDASQLVTTRRTSLRSDQSEDAALAYRLQQEEFMTAFETDEEVGVEAAPPRNTVATARENLRAMASRASRLRARGWPI